MNDVDFRPSGPVRPNSIYVSWRLFKALGYVARCEGCTRDDVMDKVMLAWIAEKHPLVLAHIGAIEATEKAFVEQLQTPTTEDIPT